MRNSRETNENNILVDITWGVNYVVHLQIHRFFCSFLFFMSTFCLINWYVMKSRYRTRSIVSSVEPPRFFWSSGEGQGDGDGGV